MEDADKDAPILMRCQYKPWKRLTKEASQQDERAKENIQFNPPSRGSIGFQRRGMMRIATEVLMSKSYVKAMPVWSRDN